MSQEYQHILENAMSLPRNERFALVQAILSQIKGEVVEEQEEEALPWETDALFRDLDRRMEELRSGRVKAIPGDEVMAKLRKRIG
jgi:putative addiction module component (TIGR02574 family)